MRRTSLAYREGLLMIFWIQSLSHHGTQYEEFWREENTIAAAEVLAVRTLKAGKGGRLQFAMKSNLKRLKPWLKGLFAWLVCIKWSGVLGRAPKGWQTEVIFPLSLPGKVYAKYLDKLCRKTIERKLKDTQCGFRPGHSTTDQIFTLQQIFENLGNMPKTCFVDLEKAYDRFPCENLGECHRRSVLTTAIPASENQS